MTNVLFICGKARMRSPTAADLCAEYNGVKSDFAGLSNDADERLSLEQINWADAIFVMEKRQKKRLMSLFGNAIKNQRVVCLNVPDKFEYMQPELVEVLTQKLTALR